MLVIIVSKQCELTEFREKLACDIRSSSTARSRLGVALHDQSQPSPSNASIIICTRLFRNTHGYIVTLTRATNNVTMTTITTRMLLIGLSFIGTISVASGYACTYRGQGASSCKVEEAQDVWLERSSHNYNDWEFLLIGKLTDYPLKRSLLQFEDFSNSTDCPTVRTSKAVESGDFHHAGC